MSLIKETMKFTNIINQIINEKLNVGTYYLTIKTF